MIELKCSFGKEYLVGLLTKQLSNFFLVEDHEIVTLQKMFDKVWERLYSCFKPIEYKYFVEDGKPVFNPYHTGQYLIYLYLFSNTCSYAEKKTLADKLYYLNKIMHACDIYHEVCLPESFFLEHPVGTVLGRAKYGNHFVVMQNCTVGGNKGFYPVIGNNVIMYSGSKILGKSIIGDRVTIAANTYIKDTNIPDDVTVFGSFPNLIIKRL